MSHMGTFFGKTCPERHDHQCFDGAPCGRDQWVLVGAVDSCTQERQGKRITVSSIQIHTEREVDINMHRCRQSTEALSKSVCDVNIRTRRTRQWTLMLVSFCAVHLSRTPSVPTSSMPDKNVSLCTQGPIPCLKSHLHLCSPYAVLPFLRLSVCLTVLSVSPRSSPPPAAARMATDAFIVLLLLRPHASAPGQITPATCTGRRVPVPEPRSLSSTPHLAPFRASHPGTLSLRNGRCRGLGGREGHRAAVVKICVLSRAKENQHR